MLNNTTFESCDEYFRSDTLIYISKIVWQTCGLMSIIMGVPGHCLQIILLLRKTGRKEPTHLYFIAIAICELIFLSNLFWLWLASASFIEKDPREILPCGIFYSILIGSATLSNLYLASLSADRSLIILCPTRYRSIVTHRSVTNCIVIIFIIITILLIPHYFYFYYDPQSTLFLCSFDPSAHHRQIRLWTFMHAILFVSIPSLIVCISSFIFLHNRCKHNRTYKNNLSVHARRLHRRAIFVFSFSLGLFFSFLPTCLLELFIVHDQLILRYRHCSARWRLYRILLNFFLTLTSINYSDKFYIHLFMSTAFRQQFIQFITCKSNSNVSKIMSDQNQRRLLAPVDQRPRNSSKSNE